MASAISARERLLHLGDENRAFVPSNFYGLVHLVRLLTKFDRLMEDTNITQTTRQSVLANAHDVANFLAKNIQKYVTVDDYE